MKVFLKSSGLFIFIVLFISVFSSIFGSANSFVGISLITTFLTIKDFNLGISHKIASIVILLIFPVIGCVTHYFQSNIYISFFINFLTIISIFVFTGPKYIYKSYISFLLCFIFLQSTPVQGRDWFFRIAGLLIGSLSLSLVYYFCHRNSDEEVISIKENIRNLISISPETSFIIRMSLGIPIAVIVGHLLHQPKTMWVTIVVMSLTQISRDDMKTRIKKRVQASIIGIILFTFIVHLIIPEHFYSFIPIVLGYIYSFINEYKHQQIINTINVLTISALVIGAGTSITLRFVMLFSGVEIVMMLDIIHQSVKKVYLSSQKENYYKYQEKRFSN